jgi:phenylacetate-CoA ligase
MHCDGSLVGFENGVAPSSRSTAIPLIGTVFRLNDLIGGLVLSRKMSVRDSWSRSRLLSHQRGAFLAMVRYARAASPFYRELYRGIDLTDGLDPTSLPVTSKRQVMDNFEAVVADKRLCRAELERHLAHPSGDECLFGEYRIVATAGTSGLRGIFVYDRAAWRFVLANTFRCHRIIGIKARVPYRMRICSVGADNPMHMTTRIPMSGDVGLFRLMHIEAADPIARQVAALNSFQPEALVPYPSVAALLAREQIAGRLSIHPKVVATHSEVLTPEMARLIEEAWGTRPFNHYGLTEEPHVGTDCAMHAGLHLFEDTAMVEVVDDDYRPVPDGQTGTRWLLTNLYNRAQPLIRYEVTDMLCRSAVPCPCGRPFGLVEAIGGRAEDVLRLPRGDGPGVVIVSPMVISLAIESFTAVREYVSEHDESGIHLRLVVPDPTERMHIETQLPKRLSADIARQGALAPVITLDFVEAIERSARPMGKLNVVARRRGRISVKAAQ